MDWFSNAGGSFLTIGVPSELLDKERLVVK